MDIHHVNLHNGWVIIFYVVADPQTPISYRSQRSTAKATREKIQGIYDVAISIEGTNSEADSFHPTASSSDSMIADTDSELAYPIGNMHHLAQGHRKGTCIGMLIYIVYKRPQLPLLSSLLS